MKITTYTSLLSIAAGIGSLISGIFFTAFNASISHILSTLGSHDLMDSVYAAFLSISIPFGAIFGVLIAIYTSDAIGRRKSMIITDIMALFGCAFCLAPLFSIMFIGRILCGITCGINAFIVPLYIKEIRNINSRRSATPIIRIMFTFGVFLTFLLAYYLKEPLSAESGFYWRMLYAFPLVFSVIRLIAFGLFIRFDTPAYYISKNEEKKADIILKKLYPSEELESVSQFERDAERLSRFASINSYKYERQTKIIIILALVAQFMGANVMYFHSTIIFSGISGIIREHIDRQEFQNLLLGFSVFLATLIGSSLVNKIRRRFTLVYGSLVLTGLCFFIVCSEMEDFLAGQTTLIVVFSGLQAFIFGLVMAVYCEELVPDNNGVVVLLEMLLTFVTVGVLPFIEARKVFLIFALVGVVSFVPMFKMVKETKNRSETDVLRIFNCRRGIGLLDKDVMENAETDATGLSIEL